ncbi:NfeD family protein [Chitinimonas sp. BJYL2]|uniref:NfeD family protein n=1 Tax=Chitinimonas sp. BJYL2 TaxID=2976696 RepID=UPI0022B393CD|nr:NfeD family protein [Chitinimonas sp. BJYL2]
MENYAVWFILALALAGAEMLSGTFYLLMYAVAAGVGGLAAWAGLPVPAQLALAAACAVGGSMWLRKYPLQRAAGPQSLDLGQRVEVETWHSPTSVRVRYRGTSWDGETDAPADESARPATFYIVGQRGNTLLLSATPPANA